MHPCPIRSRLQPCCQTKEQRWLNGSMAWKTLQSLKLRWGSILQASSYFDFFLILVPIKVCSPPPHNTEPHKSVFNPRPLPPNTHTNNTEPQRIDLIFFINRNYYYFMSKSRLIGPNVYKVVVCMCSSPFSQCFIGGSSYRVESWNIFANLATEICLHSSFAELLKLSQFSSLVHQWILSWIVDSGLATLMH